MIYRIKVFLFCSVGFLNMALSVDVVNANICPLNHWYLDLIVDEWAGTTCSTASDGHTVVDIFKLKSKRKFKQITILDENLHREVRFNSDGNIVRRSRVENLPHDETYIRMSYKLNEQTVHRQERCFIDSNSNEACFERWAFDKTGKVIRHDVYDKKTQDLLIKRTLFSGEVGKADRIFKFFYDKNNKKSIIRMIPSGFRESNSEGQIVNEYSHQQDSSSIPFLGDAAVSLAEKNRRLKVYQNKHRRRIAILDSGFDVLNTDISYKLFSNDVEIIDGEDNDGNSWRDDRWGLVVTNRGQVIPNLSEQIILEQTPFHLPAFPFSHGTHVTGIALKGVESFAWNGYGGNFNDPYLLLELNRRIKKDKIEFVNMSLGLPVRDEVLSPGIGTYVEMERVLNDNSQTLFVIAAGNEGHDFDESQKTSMGELVLLQKHNMLVVGATASNNTDWANPLSLLPARFSDRGFSHVDIFAPGTNVVSSNFGGRRDAASGTSMAAPWALNALLKVAEVAPNLSPLQVKLILMLTAYIPNIDKPLKCKSGGVVNLKAALRLSQAVGVQKISIKKLALKQREATLRTKMSQTHSDQYLLKLKSFWQASGL